MRYIAEDIDTLKKVGVVNQDGVIFCALHSTPLSTAITSRSLHIIPGAGPGQVRKVNHIWCPVCNSDYIVPVKLGEPILIDLLIELATSPF